jgi:hypothetical protein
MKNWIVELLVSRLGASWRTSLAGVALILSAIGTALTALCDNDPATKFNWETTTTAVLAGVALLNARDNKVTSSEVKATEDRGITGNGGNFPGGNSNPKP